ncbi:MAG: PspA/IM30 family protein [Xanthomonadales bacterium]|jgi:phage shock protein A|nr:PspA/IM30 family protein [Xanthomonadales bacterium]
MSESFASRVSRLVSGGFNAMIDAVENASPEIVMEQAIREMDQAVADIRSELGQVVANKHRANKKLLEDNDRHEQLSAQIKVAVDQKRDDLAAAAISRQMDIEAQIPVLEAAVLDASDKEKELESYINALKAKQRDMRAELQRYQSSKKAEQSTISTSANSGNDQADKATQAFERAMGQATNLPSGLHHGGDDAKLAELEKLARDNRVQERLAAIKTRHKDS